MINMLLMQLSADRKSDIGKENVSKEEQMEGCPQERNIEVNRCQDL